MPGTELLNRTLDSLDGSAGTEVKMDRVSRVFGSPTARLGLLAVLAFLATGCTIATYVNRASMSVPEGETGTVFVTVACRSGHNATGGGARVNPAGTGATLRTSEPDPAATLGTPSGWRAGFDGAAGREIEVFVVCSGSP